MRALLTRDPAWKLLSLALATVVWFTVRTLSRETLWPARALESWATRTFEAVPVLVVSAAADVHGFRVQPPAVQVTVSGQPEILRRLETRDVRVMVDLTGIEAARDLKKRLDVSVPAGITVMRVVPPEVSVLLPPATDSPR
jgi:YbbR domain-containing protein